PRLSHRSWVRENRREIARGRRGDRKGEDLEDCGLRIDSRALSRAIYFESRNSVHAIAVTAFGAVTAIVTASESRPIHAHCCLCLAILCWASACTAYSRSVAINWALSFGSIEPSRISMRLALLNRSKADLSNIWMPYSRILKSGLSLPVLDA